MREGYHEVFVSPFEKETDSEALRILEKIRECHPKESNWVEIKGGVEMLPNGKYRAFREHVKLE